MHNPLTHTLRKALVVLAVLSITVPAFAQKTAFKLKVVTDRTDAIYQVGDKAKFQISVSKNGQPVKAGKVSYSVDDYIAPASKEYPRGNIALDGSTSNVTVTLNQPGFLRCQVTYKTPDGKTLQGVAGAAFSPKKIQPSLPAPDDFDQFWNDQKHQLAKVALAPKLTPVAYSNDSIECLDVQVQCTGGAPVSGYFAKPKNAKPKSLPIILWVHGAGVRSSSLSNAIQGAKANMLSMDINAHGIPNGKSNDYYKELSAGRLKGYPHAGNDSRDTTYFRGMFLRLVRAIDFLTAQPEWDGKTVAVIGHSQGGGQALVAGGIDPRVTIIASGVPAICDHSGRAAGRINGWPKLVPGNADGTPDPKILDAARYVDAVNFAGRCKAHAIMSVGFIDRTCPPSSCYAAYNNLKGTKQVINEPLMGHAAPAHIKDAFFRTILMHIQ